MLTCVIYFGRPAFVHERDSSNTSIPADIAIRVDCYLWARESSGGRVVVVTWTRFVAADCPSLIKC